MRSSLELLFQYQRVVGSHASHRDSRQCREIARAITARGGLEQALVDDVGKRHRRGDFIRRECQSKILQSEPVTRGTLHRGRECA